MAWKLKFKKRQRRQRVTMRRSYTVYRWKAVARAAWLAGLWMAVIGVFLVSAGMAQTFWRESSWFKVRNVRVDPAAPQSLRAKLRLKNGDHLFGFSSGELEARLELAYPELKDVRVWRTLDGAVRVSVVRRMPVARVYDGQAWMGMDAQGMVFPLRDSDVPPESLTVVAGVAGAKAQPLLEFLSALKKTGSGWPLRVLKVKAETTSDVFLYLDDGTPVYWGSLTDDEEILEQKARRLERVFKDESVMSGIAYARFVDDRRVAVKLLAKPAAGGR